MISRSLGHALSDLVNVWRDTRQIVLVAQTAAVYAAILIPFKMGIPLIPGFAELRPANAFPIVASLLFGPVAAWGSGFGNLIGDCFGTLGPGSLFGFIGNFCYGYVPYLLWGRLGPLSSGPNPELHSWRQVLEFAVVSAAASVVCAVTIAWGVELLGLLPFAILAPAIFLNNLVMAWLLAPPLLVFLLPRVTRWGLRYEDLRATPAPTQARTTDAQINPPAASEDTATGAAFVQAQAVRFTYKGASRPALNDVSFSLARGHSLAVMGRSGAGKSTLCLALSGLVPQMIPGDWGGRLTIHQRETTTYPVWDLADTVGIVFQDFEAQLVSTNLEMELAFPLGNVNRRTHVYAPQEMRAKVVQMLGTVGLAGLERCNPLTLSGGQRQRLVLGSILIREPGLLVLDEPMTDLDSQGRRALRGVLQDLQRRGTALVVADHDPEVAASADRVGVLRNGSFVWAGSPRALFGTPGEAARAGVTPLPLAECFAHLDVPELPLTVEEAWHFADERGLVLKPDRPQGFDDHALAAPPIIELRQVSFAYEPSRPALHHVDLTIGQGECIALIGMNGSGKSTLARLLNGLLLPSEGEVLVGGRSSRSWGTGRLAATVGYVFQNPDHQLFAETVEEEVRFGLMHLGLSQAEQTQRISRALEAVDMGEAEVRRQDPLSLTKGDRQRVAVASVLAAQPQVLVFDEPTTGLDGEETDRMMRMLMHLNRAGHTVIIITHHLGLVAGYVRRSLVLRDGRILADGPTREVFRTLLATKGQETLGLEVPPITRFAARWGHTLLTVNEVRAALGRF